MFKQFVLLIVLYDFALCTEKRIIGGEDVKIENFPYQVAIYTGYGLCGGSIIDRFYILTAAHCLYKCTGNFSERILDENIMVYAGSSSIQNGITVRVHASVSPDNFVKICKGNTSSHTGDDIAILHLKEPLSLNNKTISAITLADEIFSNETDAIASGWGDKVPEQAEVTQTLQAVTIPIIDYNSTLLYSINYKGVCSGDSGGPLVVMRNKIPVQIGISSMGHCGYDSFFTKVPPFKYNIRKVTGISQL